MNPQPNEEEMQESFQKINEEEILKKIGRINKLNQEINGRLQKILVKVSSHEWYWTLLISSWIDRCG